MTTDASSPRRKLAALLMVDVSGFSRMVGRNEEGTTALIRESHGHVVGYAGPLREGERSPEPDTVRFERPRSAGLHPSCGMSWPAGR